MDRHDREYIWEYIWVERAQRGPMGERQWDQVARVGDRSTAREVKRALEAAGHRVYVRENNAKYPCT